MLFVVKKFPHYPQDGDNPLHEKFFHKYFEDREAVA